MSPYFVGRKCIFISGFVTGFVITLLIFAINEEHEEHYKCRSHVSWLCNSHLYLSVEKSLLSASKKGVQKENADFHSWLKKSGLKVQRNLTYQEWLANENVQVTSINMDYHQYGPNDGSSSKKLLLESEWLKSKVHVTCVVFVEKAKQAKAILDSWGPRCNKLYFFSRNVNDTKLSIVNFSMKMTSSWQILCESMNHVWKFTSESNATKINNTLEWVIFVKDDTMVIPENLRYLVAPLDFEEGHYLGHAVVLWGQAYNVGQAGFVLDKFAFRKIIENFDTPEKCASGGKYWKKEDYYLGKHLALFGIHPADTRDRKSRGIFHGYSLQTLMWGVARPGSYFTRALYPPGNECCSPRSITFSTSEPSKMYNFNYMLYNLHTYTIPGIYGNVPAPTPIPEEEVWKVALREEFNITDFTDVDTNEYFKIWRSRYAGPEQLIREHAGNFTDSRRLLPSEYKLKATFD